VLYQQEKLRREFSAPPAAKEKFCFYSGWAGGAGAIFNFSTVSLGWGGGITTLGLGAEVGTLAAAPAAAAALPWIAGAGIAQFAVRTVVCR
jgi:hypothetical protein